MGRYARFVRSLLDEELFPPGFGLHERTMLSTLLDVHDQVEHW